MNQVAINCNCESCLSEAKAYGDRRTFAHDKPIMMNTLTALVGSLKQNLDQKLIRDSKSGYADLKDEFRDSLFGIFKSYQDGEIDIKAMEKMWRSEIRDGWEKAYKFGEGSVGNPFGSGKLWDQDKTWLKSAEGEEFGYLSKFLSDIKNGTLKMDAETRLGMYVNTLDGVYHHGQVEGSPENVRIWWVLREAKHCDDCIRLAAGSPYTKKSLPGVPRNGLSKCLSRCQCFLRYDYKSKPEPEPGLKFTTPKPPRIPPGYDLPTAKQYDDMAQMSTEIDRLAALIPTIKGELQREYVSARKEINGNLIDYMEKHKLYYVPGSNYVKTEAPPVSKEVKLLLKKAIPPEGWRSPSDKEKSSVDKMASEIERLRTAIAVAIGVEKKGLIAKRHNINQEMIDYMERHKIYYVPPSVVGIDPLQFIEIGIVDSLKVNCLKALFEVSER